ncbi:MAG: hypothetical protein L6R39_007313, partial [Caloplaca ligustica]
MTKYSIITALRKARDAFRKLVEPLSAEKIKQLLNPAGDAAGRRWFPAAMHQRDKDLGFRIDRGETKDGKIRLFLQANRSATDPAIRKVPSHVKLASFDHDTNKSATKDHLFDVIDTVFENAIEGKDVPSEGSQRGSDGKSDAEG